MFISGVKSHNREQNLRFGKILSKLWTNFLSTVANSRETNKQPLIQKQAQYFLMIYYHQYDLLSIIYYQ